MYVSQVIRETKPLLEHYFDAPVEIWSRGPVMVSVVIGRWGTTLLISKQNTPESLFALILGQYEAWASELPENNLTST